MCRYRSASASLTAAVSILTARSASLWQNGAMPRPLVYVLVVCLSMSPAVAAERDVLAQQLRAGEAVAGFPNWAERVIQEWINRARVDQSENVRTEHESLALRVGQATFDRIEHTILTRYRYGNASTEDYITTAVEVSGDKTVAPFLRDWLYGTTVPPMPQRPGWTVDPVPPPPADPKAAARLRAALRTDMRD